MLNNIFQAREHYMRFVPVRITNCRTEYKWCIDLFLIAIYVKMYAPSLIIQIHSWWCTWGLNYIWHIVCGA